MKYRTLILALTLVVAGAHGVSPRKAAEAAGPRHSARERPD